MRQPERQFGLIYGSRKLLRFEEAPLLESASSTVFALGDIEYDRVSVELRSGVAVNRSSRIVFEFGSHKLPSSFGGAIAADSGLSVVFQFGECGGYGRPMCLPDTIISANQRR